MVAAGLIGHTRAFEVSGKFGDVMAKDAKGHGSEGRPGSNPAKGMFINDPAERTAAKVGQFGNAQAAAALANGHPKSVPVPVHSVMRTPGWDDETGTQRTPYEMRRGK